MAIDDPYPQSDDDKTQLMPRPGGRSPAAVAPPPPSAAAPVGETALLPTTGVNPLAAAATPLLALAIRLRGQVVHPDVTALHANALAEVRAFEGRAVAAGATPQMVAASRYALCALVDDLVLNTPWGSASHWPASSLVINFHREAVGGERFFALLDGVRKDPARNLALLELLYVCLALGFEGRYRVAPRGASELLALREDVWQSIRNQRGAVEPSLSPHWTGVPAPHRPLSATIPPWVSGVVALALVLLAFLTFGVLLNGRSDEAFLRLAQTPPSALNLVRQAKALPPPPIREERAVRLRKFLEAEIHEGLVTVEEDATTVTVRIRNRGMFDSGSDALRKSYVPVVDRISQALQDEPGKVLVAGHSDNVPIRSARFPSNWHLSKARADAVKAVIVGKLPDRQRVTAEGYSDTRPVAANDTAEGRELNRRIEVIVTKPDSTD